MGYYTWAPHAGRDLTATQRKNSQPKSFVHQMVLNLRSKELMGVHEAEGELRAMCQGVGEAKSRRTPMSMVQRTLKKPFLPEAVTGRGPGQGGAEIQAVHTSLRYSWF